MTSPSHRPDRGLDDLLGQDADPVMGHDATERLRERLAEARAGSANGPQSAEDAELDVVLAFDSVAPPTGLADRVLERVRAEREAGSPDVLVPVATADTDRRKWRLRVLLPVAGAAAAALALWMMRGQGARSVGMEVDTPEDSELVASVPETEVSDELLASLSVLENMDFVTDGLDPFEADALFLFEPEDQVLLDLLVSDDYDFDGMDDVSSDREAGGEDR